MASRQALEACGLASVILEAKEALALANGTSFMSAYAALAAEDASRLARTSDLCTALCVEALTGNVGHFHPLIHRQKPHPGQAGSAGRARGLLAGSRLAVDPSQIMKVNPELGDRGFIELQSPGQDARSV